MSRFKWYRRLRGGLWYRSRTQGGIGSIPWTRLKVWLSRSCMADTYIDVFETEDYRA